MVSDISTGVFRTPGNARSGAPGRGRGSAARRGEPFLRRNGLLFLDEDELGQMVDQLAAAQIRVDTLEEQNRALSSQSTRYWFLSGGLLLLVGIILGIWLPRIRWQRRSRYD